MTDIQPKNRAFYWATRFFRALCNHGVEHAVISPGSRSTPLTLAASAHPGLKKHVILDERSAAFTALGIGKATGMPAVLICTSGTAVANYFPAVIEAQKSGAPLILATADRPPHLRHTGANQTVDQLTIFGDYPVFFHSAGEPVIEETDLKRIERLAGQAFYYSRSRKGPVHLNFPFRKPLEPDPDFLRSVAQENKQLPAQSAVRFPVNKNRNYRFDEDILDEIRTSERPLFIVGQLAPGTSLSTIFSLAECLKAPVLCEQGIADSEYSIGIRGFEGFLRSDDNRKKFKPDLIFRFGLQPAGKSLLEALASWSPSGHLYFSDHGEWSDIAGSSTTHFTDWSGEAFDTTTFPARSGEWLKKWNEAEKIFFEKTEPVFAETTTLTDGHPYRILAPQIPGDWSVFISNSFPARDQSLFGFWGAQRIFTNRGASGIDGVTSTAIGVNIGLRRPGVLFTGDLAFLHDTNALLNHRQLNHPLLVVVINNRGGQIFRMLPIADHEDQFATYFETPQQADISTLAQTYGVGYTKAETVDDLESLHFQELIRSKGSRSNLHVLECKTDPVASMELREKVWDISI